jgi:pyruvate-formate lyase-activating enzyme
MPQMNPLSLTKKKNDHGFNLKTRISITTKGKVVFTDQWNPVRFESNPSNTSSVSLETSQVPDDYFRIPLVSAGILHGEEPELSGPLGPLSQGTCAVYVHGCLFRCFHCYQPEFFSESVPGWTSKSSLIEFIQGSLENGAKSVLFVVSHFNPIILEVAEHLKKQKFPLPIAYKHAGVMNDEQVQMLSKHIDIFVPDHKASSEEFCKLQGLPSQYGKASFKTLNTTLNTGRRTLIRYLLIPNFRNHANELRLMLESIGPLRPHWNFAVSLLSLFYNPLKGSIEKVEKSVIEECMVLLNSFSIDVIIDDGGES